MCQAAPRSRARLLAKLLGRSKVARVLSRVSANMQKLINVPSCTSQQGKIIRKIIGKEEYCQEYWQTCKKLINRCTWQRGKGVDGPPAPAEAPARAILGRRPIPTHRCRSACRPGPTPRLAGLHFSSQQLVSVNDVPAAAPM